MMYKDDAKENLVRFIPDLVAKVAQKLRRPYQIRLVQDGGYGVPREDESWNGMIGEIIRGVRTFERSFHNLVVHVV